MNIYPFPILRDFLKSPIKIVELLVVHLFQPFFYSLSEFELIKVLLHMLLVHTPYSLPVIKKK